VVSLQLRDSGSPDRTLELARDVAEIIDLLNRCTDPDPAAAPTR
jgi:hypothetical protein